MLRIVSPPRLEVRRSRACGLLRRGLTEHFLGRSEGHNPTRHAFEEFDWDGARAPARRADSAVRAGEPLGPLYGIPTAVKSPVCAEGFGRTTPTGRVTSSFDDIWVERLRSAGAIITGTNTMTGGGARMDPTNPGVFKPLHSEAEALSPWDTTRAPGWSSSDGAEAAVASLLPVTIGSDEGGSTRRRSADLRGPG